MKSKPLCVAAAITAFLYVIIAWLSWQFDYRSDGAHRPILFVIGSFAAAFVVYAASTAWVYRGNAEAQSLKWIVGAAIVFVW